jgi:hypothetical protein
MFAEILYRPVPASAGGVTVKVAVASLESEIGPTGLVAESTVQPDGRVSSTVPASKVPEPDRAWSVTSNGSPATL